MKQGTSSKIQRKFGDNLLFLFFLVLLGTSVGSVAIALYPMLDSLDSSLLLQGMGTSAAACSFGECFARICIVSLLWLLLTGAAGTSLAGMPLAGVLIVWRGVILGAVLCEVYMLQGVAGILTAVLFVMPYSLLSTFLFLLGTREAMRFSGAMFRLMLHGRDAELSIKLYTVRFLVLAVLLLLAGILQCIWLKCAYPIFLDVMTGK